MTSLSTAVLHFGEFVWGIISVRMLLFKIWLLQKMTLQHVNVFLTIGITFLEE